LASAYDTRVRAVVLDEAGQPALADVPEPEGAGELVEVLACGLCGSDVEKIPGEPGAVLGHEVVARLDGRRVGLVNQQPCGECERCRTGHETTSDRFRASTIRPGGFAERARADAWVELPEGVDDAQATMLEPLACVLRGAERLPPGRVLVVGHGFVGRLFSAVLRHRGDEVFAVDSNPARSGREPDGPVDAAVLCAPGGGDTALEALAPAGTLLVFADAGALPTAPVYRGELTVTGARSATPRHMEQAAALLPHLELPEPAVLPLERFHEGASSSTAAATRSRSSSPREGADLPRAGRRPGRGRAAAGAWPGRRPRPGRGRAHRRHRRQGARARAPGAARPPAEPVRPRVLRHRRRHRATDRGGELGAVRRMHPVPPRPGDCSASTCSRC
jgi:L-iditol 2-dehydrogenase